MKLSELIRYFTEQQRLHGDVVIYEECDDGYSTWAQPIKPKVEFRKIWKGHPEPAHYYLRSS